ncbi:hypothetical protein NEISUBOT_04474 [Neisseria subflava NJ9703]|uniref:Uncharacterized protein n=1 Tax=Neisseria subflava NJ9703 TaxID=546268 RepID=A0A9W5MZC0_NEISU|nr:hypothetical protein NEISUBOT_04474 [Neisseria subflava NJ9703]
MPLKNKCNPTSVRFPYLRPSEISDGLFLCRFCLQFRLLNPTHHKIYSFINKTFQFFL